jgi:hypothetical protein
VNGFAVTAFCLILGVSPLAKAQLTVKNPHQLYFPEDRARVIFSTACKVVAAKFHVRHISSVDFPLVVVLGDKQERYTADLDTHTYTIYLQRWDDVQFAAYSMGLAMQLLVQQQQRAKIVAEILRRSGEVLPISVDALQNKDTTRENMPTATAVSPRR